MPLFEVPRVELHVRPMLVAATSAAQARAAVRAGKGVPAGPAKFEQIGCALFRPEPAKQVRTYKDYPVLADDAMKAIETYIGEEACRKTADYVAEGDADDVAQSLSEFLRTPVLVVADETTGGDELSRIFCFGAAVPRAEIDAVREAAGKGKA